MLWSCLKAIKKFYSPGRATANEKRQCQFFFQPFLAITAAKKSVLSRMFQKL